MSLSRRVDPCGRAGEHVTLIWKPKALHILQVA